MAIKIGDAKISNAYRPFRFEVKVRDIEEGQPNDPCNCAAALALKRTTKAPYVAVYRDVTYIAPTKDKAERYHTPPSLRLETIVFDRQGAFHPGTYELQPMPLRPKYAKRTNKTGKKLANRKPRERYTIPNVRPTASQRLEDNVIPFRKRA